MASQETHYSSLSDAHSLSNTAAAIESPNEVEETPRDSGLMIHIVPETSRARWSHIEDLDSFFTRTYNYHQNHGFTVIVMDEAFQLFEFGFVVWLLTFSVHCIKHSVLFGNTPAKIHTKVTINDVIIPMGECVENFGGLTFFILFISTLYFMMRLIKMIYHVTQYSDIKTFYNSVLLIADNDLDNITWHEIKKRIREVQAEQQMCIDKEQLTELDIYHRILRFKNYMVALMNKNLLPVRFNMPIFGEVVSLSRGLSYNIDFILFRGPGSPFQNNWQLRDDYAVRNNQMHLAQRLSNLIFWVAIVNLILAPAIFLWQIIYFLFAYANILKKEPAALGMRTWSNYGRLYLRHFNELEHELDARLNRAYQHAEKYLSSFSSPVMIVVAKNVLFLTGGMLVLLIALGIYEEFVFQIEHVLTIITALSAIGLVCRTLIPDENLIWCPEQLMTAVLAHTHYLPVEWKNRAHTAVVRKEFGHFFQFKASYILNEICSPLITPFILIFVFRPKALEIVKFFKSFTVTVKGVGNVCSFAQMDIRKYGNPEWQLKSTEDFCPSGNRDENPMCYAVENGKTELSLVHFTLTNPEWRLPRDAIKFLRSIRQNALLDLKTAKTSNKIIGKNAMTDSLLSFGAIGDEYSSIANYVLNGQNVKSRKLSISVNPLNKPPSDVVNEPSTACSNQESDFEQMLQQNLEDTQQAYQDTQLEENESQTRSKHKKPPNVSLDKSTRKMRVYKCEGRLEGPSEALLYSISNLASSLATNHADVTEADMCLSSLYLHELHLRNKHTSNAIISPDSKRYRQTIASSKVAENTPLLGNIFS